MVDHHAPGRVHYLPVHPDFEVAPFGFNDSICVILAVNSADVPSVTGKTGCIFFVDEYHVAVDADYNGVAKLDTIPVDFYDHFSQSLLICHAEHA